MAAKIKTVGVVGAGQMGAGIAHVSALAGYEVKLNDLGQEQIEDGIATINGNLARQANSGKITDEAMRTAQKRLHAAPKMSDLADCDIVIEAATENEAIKRKIFDSLCENLNPQAIIATNTSSISITRLAAATDRPEQFMGIHFMNPVPVMQLVELVRGIATNEDTFKLSKAYVDSLGKTVTVSEDFPAFIVNRILLPMINEAIYTLYEGVGTVEAIDTAMKEWGFPPIANPVKGIRKPKLGSGRERRVTPEEVETLTALPKVDHTGLLRVQHQPEVTEQGFRPPMGFLGLTAGRAQDHEVIRVADQLAGAARGPGLIEGVQEDVGQQR